MRNDLSAIDPDASSAQVGETEGAAAPLLILGGDDALCIDELCVTGDASAMDPAAAEATA